MKLLFVHLADEISNTSYACIKVVYLVENIHATSYIFPVLLTADVIIWKILSDVLSALCRNSAIFGPSSAY